MVTILHICQAYLTFSDSPMIGIKYKNLKKIIQLVRTAYEHITPGYGEKYKLEMIASPKQ